jgi:hypothetical protein
MVLFTLRILYVNDERSIGTAGRIFAQIDVRERVTAESISPSLAKQVSATSKSVLDRSVLQPRQYLPGAGTCIRPQRA